MVLNYHRITTVRDWDPWSLAVSPTRFAEQLEVLNARADVVPLREAMSRAVRRWSRPVVVLTFDDGYADAVHAALPALEFADAPATFFVVSSMVGVSSSYWWDRLAFIVERDPRLIYEVVKGEPLDARTDQFRALQAIHSALWVRSVAERESILATCLTSCTSCEPTTLGRPLDEHELATLSRSRLVEIGAHTVTHPHLPSLSAREQYDELVSCRKALEDLVDKSVVNFAYPYGALDRSTPALVMEAGYALACTTHPEVALRSGNPFLIPRFEVGDWDGDEFERRFRWTWLP